MQLSKGTARTIMTTSDVLKKLLFRLKVDAAHPRRAHLIRRLSLYRGETRLAHIDVGDAMDNSPQEPSYVISDASAMDWSAPVRMEGAFGRWYRDCQGSEQHAPFVLSIPAYLRDDLACLELVVEARLDSTETVHVEMWDDGGRYIRLGGLTGATDGVHRLTLAREGSSAQLPVEPEPPARRPTEDEFSADRVLAIRNVDVRDGTGESKRVFPLGAGVRIDLEFEALREVADPVFAVTFHRVDGIQMDHKNSRLLGKSVGRIQGRGTARFAFAPLRLGPGEYLITVAILKYLDLDNWIEQPPSYDRHDRRYAISVYSTMPGGKNLGSVLQDCSFSLD